MKRLALGYLAIVLVASLGIMADPMGWLSRSEPTATNEAAPVATADLLAARLDAAAPIPQPPAPAIRISSTDLEATTAAILADLSGKQASAPATAAPDPAIEQMSIAALSALGNRGSAAGNRGATEITLQSLVTQALREGQSDAYIDALVNEAAGKGSVAVPSMLVTSEGRVDTAVLLATLVARSQGAEIGEGEGDASDPTADTALDALPMTATGDMVYTVLPGDSLGALALRFYGDASRYRTIFDANRATLTAPDRIAVGQRLSIPRATGL